MRRDDTDNEEEARYGNLRQRDEEEDEVQRRHHSDANDEEAQLLEEAEDYEQFELEERSGSHSSSESWHDVHRKQAQKRPPLSTKRGFIAFLGGRSPPKPQTIKPLLPRIQELPIRWRDKALPPHRRWLKCALLVLYLFVWVIAFSLPLIRTKGTLVDLKTGEVVRHLDCVDVLWRRNNECGLDGVDCRPFGPNESFAFRCPANCAGVRVLNPHHVGPVDVNYRPLVIGGDPVYRGDSFVCGAAVHAGVVDDAKGGCGVVNLVGTYYSYFASERNGIASIGFDSYFPLSFTVEKDETRVSCPKGGTDPRRPLLAISLLFSITLSILVTSPTVLFFVSFISTFAHVAFVSDPPNVSGPSDTILPQLVSIFAARLLPSLFVAAVIYYFVCAKRTLSGLSTSHHQLEKTILWLVPFWLGALSNDTLGWIPLSRLSAHDLAQQPGAKAALAGILLVIILGLTVQIYGFWCEGRVWPYLSLYLLLLSGLLLSLVLPGLELRIHHYILALLLLPLTSLSTRPSLVWQGFLLGLLVNGIARWGFDSVLQTHAALRGDARLGSVVPEVVAPLVMMDGGPVWTISFKWLAPSSSSSLIGNGTAVDSSLSVLGIEGISVLVNDVERYRGFFADDRELEEQVFTWTRDPTGEVGKTDEYVRFGYVGKGGSSMDYSEAGTWFVNGTWSRGAGYY